MSTSFRELVDAVRRQTDLVTIVRRDVDLQPAGSVLRGLSPFVREKTPSFVVWPSSGRWRDYAGGGDRGGDVFDYVAARENISFVDAVLRLADEHGLRQGGGSTGAAAEPEIRALVERRDLERVLTQAAGYYHHALPARVRQKWYKDRYGFTDTTVDELQLGWADGHLWEYLTEKVGVPADLALQTGLFVRTRSGVEDFFHDRLVFPYWLSGRVVYFIARATEYSGDEPWEQAKYKKLLTHSERHSYVSPLIRNAAFYNEDAARGTEELLITEGVTDCISAMQAGLPCISPVTTRFRKQDVPRLIELTRGARRVLICNDAEASGAGDAGARDTAAALFAEGRDVRLVALPRPEGLLKLDLNEFLRKNGIEALRPHLDAASGYVDYLLASLPKQATPTELDRALEPLLEALSCASDVVLDATLDSLANRYRLRKRPLARRVAELKARRAEAEQQKRIAAGNALPTVQTNGRQMRDLVEEARDVLTATTLRSIRAATEGELAAHLPTLLFRGPAGVVRITVSRLGAPGMALCGEGEVFGALLRGADWITVQRDSVATSAPPKDVARDLVLNPSTALPYLDAVLTTPVFGGSGALLFERGYHGEDACWLEPSASLDLEPVSETPSDDEVAEAKRMLLDELLVDFPFATEADRANAVAMLLLPFARRLFDGCTPIHLIEAPTPGTGKGMLARMIGLVVLGVTPDTSPLPRDEDELRKRITARLLAGDAFIVLDNVDDKSVLATSTLASTITSDPYRDRILGRSTMMEAPNRVTWVMTANNPMFNNDIARRTVRIRLDRKVANPSMVRGLKHPNLHEWVTRSRTSLVRACLTIIQSWIAAGRPLGTELLGSFEGWASTLGGILAHARIPGFLSNQATHQSRSDTESEAWAELVWFWWNKWGPTEVRATAVAELCKEHDLLNDIRGTGSERSVVSRVGRALASAEDRFFGEYQLLRNPRNGGGSSLYRLVRVGKPAVALGDDEVF